MDGFDERLRKILDGYANFLREKELALPKRQPYLVRWARDFLLFAKVHSGYTFEQTLDLFLAAAGGRVGTRPWQLHQAADAIRIYRYQYRGAKDICARVPANQCSTIAHFAASGQDTGTVILKPTDLSRRQTARLEEETGVDLASAPIEHDLSAEALASAEGGKSPTGHRRVRDPAHHSG
jgi:hypothetical protein